MDRDAAERVRLTSRARRRVVACVEVDADDLVLVAMLNRAWTEERLPLPLTCSTKMNVVAPTLLRVAIGIAAIALATPWPLIWSRYRDRQRKRHRLVTLADYACAGVGVDDYNCRSP